MKNLTQKTVILFALAATSVVHANNLQDLHLPDGFSIERLNFEVPNARQMALTDEGTLILGTRREGKVYAVPKALSDEKPQVITLAEDLRLPSGVAVKGGDLYVGAIESIIRFPAIDQNLNSNPPQELVTDQLPDATHHGWKYLKFGPDGKLYVPVGAPCNICLSDDPRFATLLRMDETNGETEIWAHGIRNTVGFAWHPEDQLLWFSDNGRDMLGDDVPHEEINRVTRQGEHFGYPFLHADDVKDPEFGDHQAGSKLNFSLPKVNIQAHSAPLGITFYNGEQFPEVYRDALFIAEHGSWNRSSKVGYRVSVVTFTQEGEPQYQPFVEGWLQGEDAWGRPNDVLVAPDGSLLIADDKLGAVYRVSYNPS